MAVVLLDQKNTYNGIDKYVFVYLWKKSEVKQSS